MYQFRLKIFILLCIGGLVIAVGRLLTLQVFHVDKARAQLAQLRIARPQQRPTVRGKITDRTGKALALDKPAFFLYINYQQTRYMDPRWQEGRIRRAITEEKPREQVEQACFEEWQPHLQDLEDTIDLAWKLADVSREDLIETIEEINDFIWERSRYIWWLRRNKGQSRQQYLSERDSIPVQEIGNVDLWEIYQDYPLVELKTHRDVLDAQIALLDKEGLDIRSESKRVYPFETAACQVIGWVAPWQSSEIELFEHDKYMSYQEGEVIGKYGLEKIYEPALRGRRGEVTYDRNGTLLERKEAEYGNNVELTLDIELQAAIEKLLADPSMPHEGKPSAVVVLEGGSNDILAIASIPTFDLNTIREAENYNRIFNPNDPNKIWQHKALERNYPPGSTAKPLILIAGLEESKITPNEAISCSSWKLPSEGWPRCLLQRIGTSHDVKFGEGGNIARNAIRGSCNVYFSQLAHRLSSQELQTWLFRFGFGQDILDTPLPGPYENDVSLKKTLNQSYGCLEYAVVQPRVETAAELELLPDWERKWWGMGQGSLRATVLQVANALSTLARRGEYKAPRLVINEEDPFNERNAHRLPISDRTLSVVRDGMHAVVYEVDGTAYSAFRNSGLLKTDMTFYGKTGSTENPEHAWFECIVEDDFGRAVIITVLVEGGLRGAGEAAPLGIEVIRLCNAAGYIGTKITAEAGPVE